MKLSVARGALQAREERADRLPKPPWRELGAFRLVGSSLPYAAPPSVSNAQARARFRTAPGAVPYCKLLKSLDVQKGYARKIWLKYGKPCP